MALSESYKNRLKSLSGQKSLLTETNRIDFLRGEFLERIGRKYDKFANIFSDNKWNPDNEEDKFLVMLADEGHFGSKHLKKKENFLKWANTLFEELASYDPTHNKQYLKWLINIYLDGNLPEEDFYKIPETLSLFYKHKEKLSINSRNANNYENLSSMYEKVLPFTRGEEMSASEREKIIKLEGAEQVYEDENWKIIIPKTLEAACLYGKSTRWCTATPGNHMFASYTKKGPLYVLINKREANDRSPKKKLQFHFDSNQFMDTTDSQIDIREFFITNPKIKEFFKKRKEITPSFEFEYKLLTKEELLNALTTTEIKIELITKKGFDFFMSLYDDLDLHDVFVTTITTDQNFVKELFYAHKISFTNVYNKLGLQKEGLSLFKNATWLNEWIMKVKDKKEIEQFIINLVSFGEDGKKFASELCKFGGVVWESCISGNTFSDIGQYFNLISHHTTFGQSGIAMAKKLLQDKTVLQILRNKGTTSTQIKMLLDFFISMRPQVNEAKKYYKNLLS
jgi:hypothetical protein